VYRCQLAVEFRPSAHDKARRGDAREFLLDEVS
jgi:hypothetical protein